MEIVEPVKEERIMGKEKHMDKTHNANNESTGNHSKSTKLIKILIIVIVLIALSTTVFFIIKNAKTKEMATTEQIFTDVPPDHFAFLSIAAVNGYGIMEGYADGSFKPDEFVTRAQFAKMMTAALSLEGEIPTWQTFIDATPNHPFYQYIEIAKDYLPGYANDDKTLYFKPDDPILTKDAISAMVNATEYDIQKEASSLANKITGSDNLTRAGASILLSWYIERRLPEEEEENLEILRIK